MTFLSTLRWKQRLQPGDKVIVHRLTGDSVEIVDRVTTTQVILKLGTRYMKSSGREHGNSIGSCIGQYLESKTP